MPQEQFPVPAFVSMISDEVEFLPSHGRTDDEIVAIIREQSGIDITTDELAKHYATPE